MPRPAPGRACIHLAVILLSVVTVDANAQNHFAITPVTVVDVADGSLDPGQTVVVEGDRIVRVGHADEVEVPEGARVVDGSGGYLIPGLWDMHIHTVNNRQWIDAFFPLLIANGVTGVRDMWHYREMAEEAAAAVAGGDLPGPARIITPGHLIDGPARIWPNSLVAYTPDQGVHLVDSLHAAGVPFIKVYSSLTPPTYAAIAARANELGIPFVGHIPAGVQAADASEAGQRSLEHVFGLLEGCSADEDAILRAFGQAMAAAMQGAEGQTVRGAFEERHRRTIETQDEETCRALADLFVENETWLVPTLLAMRGDVFLHELAAEGDDRLRYFPSWVPEAEWAPWVPPSDQEPSPFAPVLATRATWERVHDVLDMMVDRGVPILAGTDAPNPWTLPGFGIHDELELLVEAGLTPLQALRAATLNPARFLGRTDALGTVDEGKLADLVLLGANPLEDISNTQQIRAVVADGRLYDRAALDGILSEAERAAGN